MNPRFFGFAVATLALISSALAGSEMKGYKQTVVETPFDQGRWEFQLGVGGFTSFQSTSVVRPRFTDLDLTLRLGRMLHTPSGEGFFRGNLELLVEAYGAGLIDGPGTGYAGAALVFRYNFVQEGARWVPYFQIHAGGVFNDIHRDRTQRVIGQAVEFDLGGGFGLRYLCSDRCALFVEVDYRHISNADLADRNLGLNTVGGFVGASVFY